MIEGSPAARERHDGSGGPERRAGSPRKDRIAMTSAAGGWVRPGCARAVPGHDRTGAAGVAGHTAQAATSHQGMSLAGKPGGRGLAYAL